MSTTNKQQQTTSSSPQAQPNSTASAVGNGGVRRTTSTTPSSEAIILLPRLPSSSPSSSPRQPEQPVTLSRLSKQLRLSLRLSDRTHRSVSYAQCFAAHDAVEWLSRRLLLPRSAAVDCCEQLRLGAHIQAALPGLRDRPFAADLAFYQFLDAPAPEEVLGAAAGGARVELVGLRLRSVPDHVVRGGVESLALRYNEIRSLPQQCGSAWGKSLTVLDLGHNALATLPAAIGELRLLRRLRVDGNVLRELPPALGLCTVLRTLSACDNLLLERVPAELAQLKALETLQLNDTRVVVLPSAWKVLLGVLTELALDADFMRFPPPDVCKKGDAALVLKYLAKHEDEQPPLPEIDMDDYMVDFPDDNDDTTAVFPVSAPSGPAPLAPAPPLPAPMPPTSATTSGGVTFAVPDEVAPPLPAGDHHHGAFAAERDALHSKNPKAMRTRVMTLGTSQMRPTGPAPDPSMPQPWSELTDDEDVSSATVFQWATNTRSTDRLFHSGMKKFERGKLAPLVRSDPVPVEEESAPIEPAARNKKFRDIFMSGGGNRGAVVPVQPMQQLPPAMREMLVDGEQLASANAPDHAEAVQLAESIDSAWIAAFDLTTAAGGTLTNSSPLPGAELAVPAAAATTAVTTESEDDGDHIVRLTSPNTSRPRCGTAPFLAPIVAALNPMPVWVRDVRVGQPCEYLDVSLSRPIAPTSAERLMQYGSMFAARCASTYAFDRSSGVRLGDPICDHYAARIAPGRQVYAVADGCGWGQQSARAAQAASRTFVNQLHARRRVIVDMKSACLEVLLAMAEANANVKRATTGDRVGTTTLVGGVLVKLEYPVMLPSVSRLQKKQIRTRSMELDSAGSVAGSGGDKSGEGDSGRWHASNSTQASRCSYAFVMATIGDVKVFHYQAATQTCFDVSRHVSIDYAKFKSEDPGGRLGAHLDGDADLRNLAIAIVPCAAGDAFAMLSDGVHDNLDPEKLGVVPPADIAGGQWSNLPIAVADFVKRRFQRHFLEGVFRSASGLPRSARTVAVMDASAQVDHIVAQARGAASRDGSVSPHESSNNNNRSPRTSSDASAPHVKDRIGGHRAMSQSAHSLSRGPSRDTSPVRDAAADEEFEDGRRRSSGFKNDRKRNNSNASSASAGGGSKQQQQPLPLSAQPQPSSNRSDSSDTSRENLIPGAVPINAAQATEELIAFSRYVTKASRKFMWNNPRLQLPNDFSILPGKQDHGTSLVFVVGGDKDLQ